jgi:hypothetical protein
MVLRRLFRFKTEEVTRDYNNEELHNLFSSLTEYY